MIDVSTFFAPRVDSHRLAELASTGAYVRIVGRLVEVNTIEYNQECVLEMYDRTRVKVVDGPVSQITVMCTNVID
jgi:hypothetical protein